MRLNRRLFQPAADANGITQGVIWQQILVFFFPILLGTFFQQLYNTADAIILGKFVSKEALAAVGGATGTLLNLVVGFFVGLSSGASVIISQYYGGRKDKEVHDAVHTAAALAILAGVLMTVCGYFFLPLALQWMGTPEEIMGYAITYMRVFSLGMLPSLIYNIGSGVLRAIGDSRRPLYFLICACLVNIVLDIVLVVGFELSVFGAALATILSQLISAVLVVMTLCRSHQSYRLTVRDIRIHRECLGRTVRIGFPAGLQSVMYSISNIIIQAGVNAFGTDVLAAWTAYGKIDSFFWMVVSAFGISITTFVGQNFGAGQYERVKKSIRVCLGMTAAATVLLSTLLYLFGRPLLSMFTGDEQVLGYGLEIIHLLVPTYILYICIELLAGALRGAGDTLMPTVMTLFGICLLRAVWVMATAPEHNLTKMLICYPLTWGVTSLLFILYYLRSGWLNKCIRKAGMRTL